MARIFFIAIVFYLLYRLIFDFIIPVSKTTKQVRQQFKNMQDHMQQQGSPFQRQYAKQEEPVKPKSKGTAGEYIDFEEVKK